ncbi:MAG: ribosome biogenesis GTP-binding protein YihA/YsxC [Muribaculaceae bacterium]|nr:ribosome biogenesis GTP-binding protein YihA/YsxC [Muribaculaceae bacterium]
MDIKNAKYEISNADFRKCPDINVPEYAFIGRSNVGKSSLINMIGKNKNLAKTSQKPGKTLLINHFKMDNGAWYLVDLPGYGYAARGKEQRNEFGRIIKDYILGRRQLTCLFVLIDIRHDPQKIDLEFLRWLGENQVPFAIVFTKADKLGPNAGKAKVDDYLKVLKKEWEELPPIFITSSEKKTGRQELLDYIFTINKEIAKGETPDIEEELKPEGEEPKPETEEEPKQEIKDLLK